MESHRPQRPSKISILSQKDLTQTLQSATRTPQTFKKNIYLVYGVTQTTQTTQNDREKNRHYYNNIRHFSLDEFGQKKFLRLFAFLTLIVRPTFEIKIRKKADKKKATTEGRSWPLILNPNLTKILKVTLPFLGKAVYS